MNRELQEILGDYLEVDNLLIPVAQIKYTGNENTYIVWTIINEIPALSGNDTDLASVVSVDIDIFSDKNYLNIVEKIKELMRTNEWVWTGDSADLFEEDTGLYHKTCTFEKERMI